eukprot:gene9089-9259_t
MNEPMRSAANPYQQAQLNMVRSKTAHLQLLCMLVNDKVPYRCHWPAHAELTVNGSSVRVYEAKRLTGGKPLTAQQVDSAADISSHATATLAVRLAGVSSSGGYVLGARLVRRQGLQRVKQLMDTPPGLREGLQQLKQKLAGDGDVEVSTTAVSLRCPLSGCRITTPAHFTSSPGLSCFDLDSFLEMTSRTGKWQCPFSMALSSVAQLVVDPWLAAVLAALKEAGLLDSTDEVEVDADGAWRPRGAGSDAWFSVLTPPTAAQLQAAMRPEASAEQQQQRRRLLQADSSREAQRPALQAPGLPRHHRRKPATKRAAPVAAPRPPVEPEVVVISDSD